MDCYYCRSAFADGQGVEHETDSGELLFFCSMPHFKMWVLINQIWKARREMMRDRKKPKKVTFNPDTYDAVIAASNGGNLETNCHGGEASRKLMGMPIEVDYEQAEPFIVWE